ncbi:hypothetical protein SARC_16852, partial [Sphaeroforma arctica JP610]
TSSSSHSGADSPDMPAPLPIQPKHKIARTTMCKMGKYPMYQHARRTTFADEEAVYFR